VKQNTTGPELRNQTESQSDGFGEGGGATAGHENTGDRNGDFTDQDKAIRESAYQLYKGSNHQDGNADEHWLQAERELRSGGR
jgi:hypothetical protein